MQHEAKNLSTSLERSTEVKMRLYNKPNYRQLVEKVDDVIWSTDMDGRFTYLSPQFKTLTGFDPIESRHTLALDYVHADDQGEIEQALNNLFAGKKSRNREFRHRRADGSYTWVMSRATLIHDKQSKGVGTQGILRDISEQKSTEQTLQATRDHLKLITENVPGMIVRHKITKTGNHHLLYVGPQCLELFEISPADAVENIAPIHQRIHPDDRHQVLTKLQQAAKSLSRFRVEYRVNLPRKGMRWIQSTSQPSLGTQGDVIFDGMVTDITEQKKTEFKLQEANKELARVNQLKDSFLTNMSHELRTPLAAISNINEGLQSGIYGPISPQQAQQLDVIRDSSNHLTDLIDEVLDLSKIEAGSVDLSVSRINLRELCESACKLVQSSANINSIQLVLKITTKTTEFTADEKRVKQILVNLLSNAIKFSTKGDNVTLTIEDISNDKAQSNMLRFSVTDTGIGLNEIHRESVFEPFYQVHTELNRSNNGIGLGLPLVKRFAELHAGYAGVTSSVGKGSCFYVDLPLQQNTQPPRSTAQYDVNRLQSTPQCEPKETATNAKKNQTRILLAEDNDSVAHAIERYLEFCGFHILRAYNGKEALDICINTNPNVILMDIQMPEIDGLEAIRRLRKIPNFKYTPIIALTGLAMNEDKQRCINAGADLYLSKPYRMRHLVTLIEELLQTTDGERVLSKT